MACSRIKSLDFQPLPEIGSLAKRSNCGLDELRKRINHTYSSATVYSYVIRSVRKQEGILQHYGCGPNWQGGVITLCTCKHFMRTFLDVNDWPGTWVAGFSNIRAGSGKNILIYIMRVSEAFESHYELWYGLPRQIKWAKAVDKKSNILGDIYRPLGRETQKAPFSKSRYHQPCPSHVHGDGWAKDINYKQHRRAALLVGDVKNSFVWNQSKITFNHNIGRGQIKHSLKNFLRTHLCKANQ